MLLWKLRISQESTILHVIPYTESQGAAKLIWTMSFVATDVKPGLATTGFIWHRGCPKGSGEVKFLSSMPSTYTNIHQWGEFISWHVTVQYSCPCNPTFCNPSADPCDLYPNGCIHSVVACGKPGKFKAWKCQTRFVSGAVHPKHEERWSRWFL